MVKMSSQHGKCVLYSGIVLDKNSHSDFSYFTCSSSETFIYSQEKSIFPVLVSESDCDQKSRHVASIPRPQKAIQLQFGSFQKGNSKWCI